MKHRIFIATTMFAAASINFVSGAFGQSGNQTAQQKAEARVANSITDRVLNETGQPMPNARVFVNGMGRQAASRTVSTDAAGRFLADDLPRATYVVTAQVSGYVLSRDPRELNRNKPGDSVDRVMKKGGVITGTVTNSDGEPVVGVQIGATLIRDEQGRHSVSTFGAARYTDERGVYRLFGLPAGTYLVAAAPRTAGSSMLTACADDAPTYYPSSTRDTAAEVSLQYGAEASGKDIRYRGERGYAISGSIADASMADSTQQGVSVLLFRASNDTLEGQAFVQPRASGPPFAIYGVTDGDYYLTARRGAYQSDDGAASKRVPVKVRGRTSRALESALRRWVR